ncbi:AraC family transcriptional regulator [Aeromicrobium wangtongii]|uniref:AraC family transcriptional regulator n=1 Tax=Aeromicrobium wangtongii TaxID=2969247 RepID=A0ABY5M6Q8_9ACTN|nr:AraC family transcriptional regulator [Aeromicrobium wangtongii]MCD9198654.1 AraC family transcriptional regulator [Aeromicrobium wangtongii]UUP12678.1 AraC family transcriptional regulator [Aeromicrobium wangtongii]
MERVQELRELILRSAGGAIRRELAEGVRVGVVERGSRPTATMTNPSMTLVAGGRKRTSVGDLDFIFGPGQFFVASLDLPATGHVANASPDDPFVVFTLALRPAVIAGLLLDTVDVAEPPQFAGMAVAEASDELIDAVSRLVRLADNPADMAALSSPTEREIVWRLLTGPLGGVVAPIGSANSSIAHISRATTWMREHLADPAPVEVLARLAGMSVSTFHRHFRAATSMTPIQWQKALRLRQARILLASGDATVAVVASAVGYGSISQFSREYRRTFGRAPGQDSARLRGNRSSATGPLTMDALTLYLLDQVDDA